MQSCSLWPTVIITTIVEGVPCTTNEYISLTYVAICYNLSTFWFLQHYSLLLSPPMIINTTYHLLLGKERIKFLEGKKCYSYLFHHKFVGFF
jgi:hypothetical protein